MREKITVLIADDNQEFSTTLATYLKNQEDMVVVGRAKDGNEALDMVSSTNARRIIIRCNNATFRWNRGFRTNEHDKIKQKAYLHNAISSWTRQSNPKSN